MIAETPSVFLEAIIGRDELNSPKRTPAYYGIPRFAKEIRLGESIQLTRVFHWYSRTHIGEISTTVMLASADFLNAETYDLNRKLRLYISRLNAEYSTLRRVLRAMATEELKPDVRSSHSDLLQAYLYDTIKRIGRFESHLSDLAGEERDVASAAKGVLEATSPGEIDSLRAQIDRLSPRPVIRRLLETMIPQIYVQGDLNVGDQFNNFGNANIFGKNVQVEGGVSQPQAFELAQIATELDQVRRHLERQPESASRDSELEIINEASTGAKAGNHPKLVAALKTAGSLTYKVIKDLGLPLLTEFVKAHVSS